MWPKAGRGYPRASYSRICRGRVGDVVRAAHHVGDPHQGVVHHRREVVDRRLAIVRADDDEVVDLLGRHLDPALDQIVPDHLRPAPPRGTGWRPGGPPPDPSRGRGTGAAATAWRPAPPRAAPPIPRPTGAGIRLPLGRPAASTCSRYSVSRSSCRYGPTGPPTSGPSSQSSASQRRPSRMARTASSVERSTSVSSMRRMNVPPCARAKSQL